MAVSNASRPATTGSVVAAFLDEQSSIVEVTIAGGWGRELWLTAYRTIGKCLTSQPNGLAVDLLRLDDPFGASAPFWFAMQGQAHRMQPPVPIATCVRHGSSLAVRLNRLGARRHLAVFPDMRAAKAALAARRTLTDQIRFDLPPEPRSAAMARQIVDAACHDWDLAALSSRAQLVTSELVGNAVEHAATEICFIASRLGPQHTGITRTRNVLHLAVHDQDSTLPPLPHGCPPPLRPTTRRGQGLHIVDAAADHWGALRTRRGKMVWAILRDRG